LTRLYSPQDFGLLAVYASLLALINVISSLRYELAIPLPKDDEEAAHIVVLSLVIVIGTTLLTSLLVIFFSEAIAKALGVEMLAGYLWLLPIGVVLAGAYSIFNYWSIRTKAFGRVAATKLRQSLVTISIQLLAFKLGGIALLCAQVAGQSTGTVSLARPALASAGFKQIRWVGISDALRKYRRFPIFSTVSGLANSAGMQLPPLMFAAIFSPGAAGVYVLANRVLSLPMSIIGNAIGQVFYANAAEAYRRGELGPLVEKLHAKLAHIGMAPALVLVFFGQPLFTLVFGSEWQEAGWFARWMAPWLYFVFVSSPLSTLFSVAERQKEGLLFQIVLLISRVIAILIGAWYGDMQLTIMLFSGVSALCWLGFLFWVSNVAGNSASMMVQPTLYAFAISLACIAPLLIGISLNEMIPQAWSYALPVTILMIGTRYWVLLKKAY